MIPPSKQLIVVTPVYEDLEASAILFSELGRTFNGEVFVCAVDDGSVRFPLGGVGLTQAGISGVVLKLRRNVGHQRAISIGMGFVETHIHEHQRVIVMDSDGEDLPETIPNLLKGLEQNDVDVVVAQRKSRVESLRFKFFYAIYKHFFRFMTGHTISFGNFMALKPSSLRRLVAMQELPIHVAGTVLASKLRTERCPLDRGPRYAGQSKMNFVGLALHGFKGLMIFAEDVLVRVGIACVLIAAVSVLLAMVATALKIMGFATPGWFSVAFGILVLMFLQTGALALMTLLLTGVVRGGSVASPLSNSEFIEEVLWINAGAADLETPQA